MISLQAVLGSLLLPPVGLLLLGLLAGLAAWRRSRAGLLAALAAAGVILLATPLVAGLLTSGLVAALDAEEATPGAGAPAAIIILGGDSTQGPAGPDIGQLTLERLRAGAALHRANGLPILVSGGLLRPGQPSLATLMARSLEMDFGVRASWVEDRSVDTRENAAFSSALLRADGIAAALLVSQAWHLPRAMESFAREGLAVQPAPVRQLNPLQFEAASLVPRADHLLESWFAIHEWAGRAFYALRDGAAREGEARS
jgi:uncharacterized SAM-binding protein YcdF (DUF218 family)